MSKERLFLDRALELARKGITEGGGPFGAVIVRDEKIISEAYNNVVPAKDPTSHAEISAIRKAAVALDTHKLEGCTLYTSCEPCPMCLGAIYWSGIRKVVYAADRSDAAAAGFSDDHIYREAMLDPSSRKIIFIQLDKSGGQEVLTQWNEYENKIPY
jgi:guanine deaminase